MLDKMALIKGLPVIIGLILVIISFVAQFIPGLSFLIAGQWLLHLGIIIGLGGMLFSDTL
ncbi:MAG: hypothetical protein AAF485_14225 [Chloroflexota bacterium]